MKNEHQNYTGFKIRMLLYLMPLVILIALVITANVLSIDITYDSDLANWATLVVEIGIGIAISLAILIHSNNQQKKFTEQQDKISNLVNEVKKLTEEQKRFREGRHRWALVFLRLELSNLHSLLVQEPYQGVHLDLKRLSSNMEQIIGHSGDAIESQFIYDIKKICEIIHESTDEKKMIADDIFSNLALHDFVNRLISQIEKIYPSA